MPGRIPGVSQAASPALVRDGFPDEFGDVDDEIRFFLARIAGRADLADGDADDVVEPAVRLAVGQVEDRADDLPAG